MISDRILMAAVVCLSLGGAVGVNVAALAKSVADSRTVDVIHAAAAIIPPSAQSCPPDRTRVLVSPGVVKCAKDLTEPK